MFYITSRTPTTDEEWGELQAKTLTLAESANLLMMPGRTRPGQWNKDARQMLDAAWGAFKAAKAKDAAALEAVSDQLYESCVSCHKAYRPDYGKPKPPPGASQPMTQFNWACLRLHPCDRGHLLALMMSGEYFTWQLVHASYTSAPASNTAALSRASAARMRFLRRVDQPLAPPASTRRRPWRGWASSAGCRIPRRS